MSSRPSRSEAEPLLACEHAIDATAEGETCLKRLCAGSAGSGHEDRLVVLAGAAPRPPVHVPLVTVDEIQARAPEDLRVEIAAVVHHDADAAPERERAPRVGEHACDAFDVLPDRGASGTARLTTR